LTFAANGDDTVATLVIPLTAEEFRHASTWLAEVAHQHELPDEIIELLDLCLNEALANVLSHGGPASTTVPITLSFQHQIVDQSERLAVVCIEDSGSAFDPTTAGAKPRPHSLSTAEPGGHGLVIIRAFSDQLSYEYRGQRNVLRFAKRWWTSQ
jgi:anti-sigma regulatory factor (Ser/Thr protein kinase)